MQPPPNALHPEQHNAEKAGLEKEGGQHLVAHQRADDVTSAPRQDRPVGAELVGEHDAGDHAHGEVHGEDLQPVAEQVEVRLPPGPQPQPLEHRQVARQPDGEGGKEEVEGDGEGELEARQVKRAGEGIPQHGPRTSGSRVGQAKEVALAYKTQGAA